MVGSLLSSGYWQMFIGFSKSIGGKSLFDGMLISLGYWGTFKDFLK
jgi:hypothetical protein